MQAVFLLVTLVSAVISVPSNFNNARFFGNQRNQGPVPILRDNRDGPSNGVYNFDFASADGVRRYEQGTPSGPNGAVVQQGGWSVTYPDGTVGDFRFVADEFGFRVESPLVPTPPPMPRHAIEQIERAARERAQGIVHDGQYDPVRYGGGQYDPVRYGGGQYDPARYGGGQSGHTQFQQFGSQAGRRPFSGQLGSSQFSGQHTRPTFGSQLGRHQFSGKLGGQQFGNQLGRPLFGSQIG
ncbi:pupal cuticle protein 36 isoform X2 [Hyalella azteca]|uniref:Pupal cuticle protein 36 isoform X2 n=1 Tax=Hyalella azteca TaxID=294128 RepID=A0A8B7NDU9_HYAAZ|nr:pupal cuticle protein 36 isoform X2 [Hyalella azteca]